MKGIKRSASKNQKQKQTDASRLLNYHSNGEYYKEAGKYDKSSNDKSHYVRKFKTKPRPFKISTQHKKVIDKNRMMSQGELNNLLPVNDATKQLLHKKIYNQQTYAEDYVQNKKAGHKKLLRKNHFISKNQKSLNKDILGEDTVIRNAQSCSRDLPEWCLSTMRFYSKDYNDASKKKKKVVDPRKRDIFDQVVKNHSRRKENFKFGIPYLEKRSKRMEGKELKLMGTIDQTYPENRVEKGKRKCISLSRSKLDFDWKERKVPYVKEQTYTSKIGTGEYHSLVRARFAEREKRNKIKIFETNPILKKKLKPVPLKIGADWNPHNTIFIS